MCEYLNSDNALTVSGRRRIEEKNVNLAKQTADEMKKLVVFCVESGFIKDVTVYSYGDISISFRSQKQMLSVTYCKCDGAPCVCKSKLLQEDEYVAVANKYRITPAEIANLRDKLSVIIRDELAG